MTQTFLSGFLFIDLQIADNHSTEQRWSNEVMNCANIKRPWQPTAYTNICICSSQIWLANNNSLTNREIMHISCDWFAKALRNHFSLLYMLTPLRNVISSRSDQWRTSSHLLTLTGVTSSTCTSTLEVKFVHIFPLALQKNSKNNL